MSSSPKLRTASTIFATRIDGGEYVIEFADDDCGIDWQRVALKAAAFGLPHAKQEELV